MYLNKNILLLLFDKFKNMLSFFLIDDHLAVGDFFGQEFKHFEEVLKCWWGSVNVGEGLLEEIKNASDPVGILDVREHQA